MAEDGEPQRNKGLPERQACSCTIIELRTRSIEVRKRLSVETLPATRSNPNPHGVAEQLPSYSLPRVAIYRRLREQGKRDRVARIAAARKLLPIPTYNESKNDS